MCRWQAVPHNHPRPDERKDAVLREGALPMADDASTPLTSAEAYDQLAATYAARIDSNLYNAQYERPATLSLLPEVRGLCVLDADCGPGVYAEWLAAHDAEVVAFDASAAMVHLARARLGETCTVLQADLGQPLTFAPDGAFDLVLSTLALDFVADWDAVFGEFHRVLAPQGQLVFSVNHPFYDAVDFATENYFATEAVTVTYGSLGEVGVPTWRRPLSAIIAPLLLASFTLERLLEPEPTEAFRATDPERAAALRHRPMFLCISARKAPVD
jgi:SAM-dependent methyltransferase